MGDAQVGAVLAYECANCGNNTEGGPATPVLQSLPGLVNVDRLRDFTPGASFLGSIIIRNTAFQNMLSFSGLRCSTGQYNFQNNRALTSLSGFAGVGYSYFRPGPFGYVVNNALPSPASVASWRILAGCGSASPIVSNGLLLQVGGCSLQVTWKTHPQMLASLRMLAFTGLPSQTCLHEVTPTNLLSQTFLHVFTRTDLPHKSPSQADFRRLAFTGVLSRTYHHKLYESHLPSKTDLPRCNFTNSLSELTHTRTKRTRSERTSLNELTL